MARKSTQRTAAGTALLELSFEIARTFFKLRAAGKGMGAVTRWGGGLLGLLASLDREGSQTVPQLARARPVARQRIQRLADELAADGLIEFVDNPAHKRSRLLRLTPQGKASVDTLMERMGDWTEEMANGMDAAELRTALSVLRAYKEKLEPYAR